MEQLSSIIANIYEYWLYYSQLVTIASMVAAATKNKTDDKYVGKLVAFTNKVKLIASLNVFHAKPKE